MDEIIAYLQSLFVNPLRGIIVVSIVIFLGMGIFRKAKSFISIALGVAVIYFVLTYSGIL